MTTAAVTYNYNPGRPNLGGLLVLLVLAATTIATGVVLGTHAAKHSLADTVRNCPKDKLGLVLISSVTGRKAQVCEFEPGEWGVLITETEGAVEKEVTTYASRRPARNALDVVIRQLYRKDYRLAPWIRPDLTDTIVEIMATME